MIDQILNGKYRFIQPLSRGFLSTVHEAEELASGRRVAVKVLSAGDGGRDRDLEASFHREAEATKALDTDHIARVFAIDDDAETGQPFMVLEYLLGESLAQTLERLGPLPVDTALRILAQACAGIAVAHAAGVVHRDLKPANLFLAERQANDGGGLLVKVLDFGVAKIKMDQANFTDETSLKRDGRVVGTPRYMSPEQARGNVSLDHRTDLWSLGVVLYQALTGRTPNHDIDALDRIVLALVSTPPRPVQELAAWVPPEVAAIVERALRMDPAERFQSAEEMRAALLALLPDGATLTAAMLTPRPTLPVDAAVDSDGA